MGKKIDSFRIFCKDNMALCSLTALCLLFIYFVKLVNGNVGIDTERYIQENGYPIASAMASGRQGELLLELFYPPQLFSVYTFNFISVLFLGLSAILWIYLFSRIEEDKSYKFSRFLFLLFYVSSGVWVEVIYFTPYAVGYLFTVVCCPIVTYFLAKSIYDRNIKRMAGCIFITFFLLIIYQAIFPMWLGGLLIFLYLICKSNEYQEYKSIFLYSAFSFGMLVLLYVFFLFLSGGLSSYLVEKTVAGSHVNFKRFILYIYCLFFSNIRNSVIENYFVSITGESLGYVHSQLVIHSDVSTIWFFPLLLCYYISVIKSGNKILNKLVLACCPLTVLFFPVMGGGYAIVRTQWTIPLMGGWMSYYVFNSVLLNTNKYKAYVLAVCSLCSGLFLCERSAAVNYIDQIRYEEDVHLSYVIDETIQDLARKNTYNEIYIWTQGKYVPALAGYDIYGETSGHSIYGWDVWGAGRGVYLMNILGMERYKAFTREQYAANEKIYSNILASMPSYPQKGCVQMYNNVALVKFSD